MGGAELSNELKKHVKKALIELLFFVILFVWGVSWYVGVAVFLVYLTGLVRGLNIMGFYVRQEGYAKLINKEDQ